MNGSADASLPSSDSFLMLCHMVLHGILPSQATFMAGYEEKMALCQYLKETLNKMGSFFWDEHLFYMFFAGGLGVSLGF